MEAVKSRDMQTLNDMILRAHELLEFVSIPSVSQ